MTNLEIFDKACERGHLTPCRAGSYWEGLEVLSQAIEQDTSITPAFRENLTELLITNLVARLKVDDYIAANPGVRQKTIHKPVIVFGLPRTGTTLVSHLLATDPARRSLRHWEAAEPVPPATTETLLSDPRCLRKHIAQELLLALDPRLARAHWEFAEDPTECDSLLSQDFKSAHWAMLVPQYGNWLHACDMRPAYAHHKSVLQMLQAATHGRWNLKSTCHGLFIDTLQATYPDVRMIWTHRDPFRAFASTCSLVRAQQAILGAQVDSDVVRSSCEVYLTQLLTRSLRANPQLSDGTVYHLWYNRLLQSPIEEMRELYRWLGDDFTPPVEERMRSWLSAHPQAKYGKHQYSLAEFNIRESTLPDIFHDYLTHFSIAREAPMA